MVRIAWSQGMEQLRRLGIGSIEARLPRIER